MIKQKKAQIGLDVVKAVMVVILVLSVIGVSIFISLEELTDAVGRTDTITGSPVINESGAYINSTGYTLAESVGLTGFSATITAAYNATDGTLIESGNYTLTDATLTNATVTTYDDVNVSYTYTYTVDSNSVLVEGNVSQSVSGFFSNAGTIFSILAVVVIILAIAIIIGVVSKFGKSGTSL